MFGSFYSNQSHAQILEIILNNPDGLRKLLSKDDVFIADRGFCDVVNRLKQEQYKTFMPALKAKNKHLSTKEANHSRVVTKIR